MKTNRIPLGLPFFGERYVFWGGDTQSLNLHHGTPNQKFAFDFVVIDIQGCRFKSSGNTNTDYFVYGKEILSPGDGKVIVVIDGVPENKPGSMNSYSGLGNAVFIEHVSDEVSIIAHLQPNKIKVKPGETVKAGQIVGYCGNSGNSSEPHLHYHLQDNSIIQNGKGIKIFFDQIQVKKLNRISRYQK